MQQENITLDSDSTIEIEEHVATRGPVLLQPELLAWICGGVSSEVDLPRAGW